MNKALFYGSVIAVAAIAATARPAAAIPVGLELALLIDVSGSVDDTEYALQKQGYVQAFQSASLQSAITGSTLGSIAVAMVEWSGVGEQAQTVTWTLVNSAATANAFADAINATSRSFAGNTAPGSALAYITPQFLTNGFEGPRFVIDVSGDGAENDGVSTLTARNTALSAGITINGLPILGEAGLQDFYQNNIVGGPGSFLEVADTFGDFATAVQNKLVREVTPVPEPASFILLAAGLGAVSLVRRRLSD